VIPPGLEAIVRRSLEPDPAARYQSVTDLRRDLERWISAAYTGKV